MFERALRHLALRAKTAYGCQYWLKPGPRLVTLKEYLDNLVLHQHGTLSSKNLDSNSHPYADTVRTATPYPGTLNVHPPLALPVTVLLSGFTVTLRG